jgi:hypothetical protein
LQMGDYDAENKPLHKDVKMKKLGEKYNIWNILKNLKNFM